MEMETKQDESHTTRLILECNADAGDLSKGVVVHLSNAKQVFDNLNIKDAVQQGYLDGYSCQIHLFRIARAGLCP